MEEKTVCKKEKEGGKINTKPYDRVSTLCYIVCILKPVSLKPEFKT